MTTVPKPPTLPTLNEVKVKVTEFGDVATKWLFDEEPPPQPPKQIITVSLFVGRQRHVITVDRSLPVSWLVSELIRLHTRQHGVGDPGIIGLRRIKSDPTSVLNLQTSIGKAVKYSRPTPPPRAPSPNSVNTPMLLDITNSGPGRGVAYPSLSCIKPVFDVDFQNRWGPDDAISLQAIVSHPCNAPEVVSARSADNTMVLRFQDGEEIEVEDLIECEEIHCRKIQKTDAAEEKYTWRDLKSYVVQEGGRLVQKTMREIGLGVGDPGVNCAGWHHPEHCPDGMHLTPEMLTTFFTWVPKIDQYQGGDQYRKNLAKIDKMLAFGIGPQNVATCDYDLVEKMIIKYDGTYTGKKRRMGPHRQQLETWFGDIINPPPKKNYSIFEEDGEVCDVVAVQEVTI